MTADTPSNRLRFGRDRRIAGRGSFKRVLDGRARIDCDAFAVHARPAEGPLTRLGISIGRRCGTAARRNRIKRMLRESFRLSQRAFPLDAPAPYDLVVVVRPHEPMPLETYRSRLEDAIERLHGIWTKRRQRETMRATTQGTPSDPASNPTNDGARPSPHGG